MATPIDRFNPVFSLFPIQNNRTAWQPVFLPVVLAVPYKRSAEGADIPQSQVYDVKFFIENAPSRAKVAGFKNEGILVPELERFSIDISDLQLQEYRISVVGQVFEDQDTGEEKTYQEAQDGDYFYYTLLNGGVRDKITYYADADYYDMSPVSIGTIELTPYGLFNFVWQASYNERVVSQDNELICISDSAKIARTVVEFNHPGDVHRGMVENTPNVYFDQVTADQDGTVKFYRPFADVLQDIFDEHGFLQGINWVETIPAQYIPYLTFLIGWDSPYFSGIEENIRRSFVRNARKIQKLKGSKRAIFELFEIFGFTISIVNLWYRSDGKAFIGPFDPIERGFENDYVTLEEVCATEPLISDSDESGFGDVTLPLLYRASDDITIEAFLVQDGVSRDELLSIVDQSTSDPDKFEQETCATTADGMLISDALDIDTSTVIGYSKVLVDRESGQGVAELKVGEAPLNQNGITYDGDKNELTIVYDRYLDLTNAKLFIFAIYNREKITPSPTLTNLRSNRFDIRVLLFKDGEQPTSDTLDFLLDYLFRIKAFHSLLRKIVYFVELSGVYNVTDFCLGGLNKQATGKDAGELQVPPPVIPTDPTCLSDETSRGFKEEDITLRESVISGLEEEHETWKNLDGTHDVPAGLRPLLESLSRVDIPYPDTSPCEFTRRGQKRVIADPNIDLDHHPDDREKLCDIRGNTRDYCYKGRVEGDIAFSQELDLLETIKCKPCLLPLGEGVYWYGDAPTTIARWFDKSNYGESWSDKNFVRKAAWGDPLRYTNRSLIDVKSNQDAFLAVRKPSLQIEKDNLFFPGHRFLRMYALEYDFEHPNYFFKPWDDLLNLPCPEDVPLKNGIPVPIPDLNTHIVEGTDGNEWLVFDEVPLVYYGNGLKPDIPSLGNHFVSDPEVDEDDVTHSILSSVEPLQATEKYVELEGIVETSDDSICVKKDRVLFDSANDACVCAEDSIEDYSDGYPAETGGFQYDETSGFIGDDTGRLIWARLLGIPLAGSDVPELLFKLGSGVRADLADPAYKPYRLDCGCLKFQCDSEAEELTSSEVGQVVNRCNLTYYIDQFGNQDFDCDKVDIYPTMLLSENWSACSIRLDGEINSLFLLDENKVNFVGSDNRVGRFSFKDEWGIIHSAVFTTDGIRLDITWTTMEPRVWGEEPSGYKDGNKVFRRGTITVQRQILIVQDGQTQILAEGFEQSIGYFQSNIVCGDNPLLDPFIYHIDCAVTDQVIFEIKCGPRWADPAEPLEQSAWPEIFADSSGDAVIGSVTGGSPFYWIDVWGNEESGEITPCD